MNPGAASPGSTPSGRRGSGPASPGRAPSSPRSEAPSASFRSLLVGGTNGKGSTAAALSRRSSTRPGVRVGLYDVAAPRPRDRAGPDRRGGRLRRRCSTTALSLVAAVSGRGSAAPDLLRGARRSPRSSSSAGRASRSAVVEVGIGGPARRDERPRARGLRRHERRGRPPRGPRARRSRTWRARRRGSSGGASRRSSAAAGPPRRSAVLRAEAARIGARLVEVPPTPASGRRLAPPRRAPAREPRSRRRRGARLRAARRGDGPRGHRARSAGRAGSRRVDRARDGGRSSSTARTTPTAPRPSRRTSTRRASRAGSTSSSARSADKDRRGDRSRRSPRAPGGSSSSRPPRRARPRRTSLAERLGRPDLPRRRLASPTPRAPRARSGTRRPDPRRRVALPRRRGPRRIVERRAPDRIGRPDGRRPPGVRRVRRVHEGASSKPFEDARLAIYASRASPARRAGTRSAGGGTDLRLPDRVPARPRPDRPLARLPPAQAQDAGLHPVRGGPLPDAPDAHARGDAGGADDRADARPERGPDRGVRPRARPRAHAVRPLRREGAEPDPHGRRAAVPSATAGRGAGRRLQAQLPVGPRRRRSREAVRAPGAQPDERDARGDPQAHDLEAGLPVSRSSTPEGLNLSSGVPPRGAGRRRGPTRSPSRRTTSRTAFRSSDLGKVLDAPDRAGGRRGARRPPAPRATDRHGASGPC